MKMAHYTIGLFKDERLIELYRYYTLPDTDKVMMFMDAFTGFLGAAVEHIVPEGHYFAFEKTPVKRRN